MGKELEYLGEVKLEGKKGMKRLFEGDIEVGLIGKKMSRYMNVGIEGGKRVVFVEEMEEWGEGMMGVGLLKEDYREVDVIGGG